jgi:hypothetical protein
MLQVVQSIRDLREFLAAKRRKREPIRWNARGATEAAYVPRSIAGFANFRAALRGVGDWGQASERVDAIADALRRRHGCELPLPRKVIQNGNRSLTLFWEGVTVCALPDGVRVLIGGTTGRQLNGVTNELLDMLGFQARVQRA